MKLGLRGWSGVVAVLLIWAAAYLFWLYAFPSPIELMGGDTVTPQKVRAGERVSITRNFRVLRAEPLNVTREAIRGDCKKSCEVIDLTSSTMTLPPGEYRNVVREHTIPIHAEPGIWRLVFSVHWQGRFGRYVSESLPELTIEVIQ